MKTCPHCLNPHAETPEEWVRLFQSPDAEPCPCVEATCGHYLCEEMDDLPPCPAEGCGRCASCCPCICERCRTPYHGMDECMTCLTTSV